MDRLNEEGSCEVGFQSGYRNPRKIHVLFDRKRTSKSAPEGFYLTPHEALRLLVWLQQHRDELEAIREEWPDE
jgi:hypothetical protein